MFFCKHGITYICSHLEIFCFSYASYCNPQGLVFQSLEKAVLRNVDLHAELSFYYCVITHMRTAPINFSTGKMASVTQLQIMIIFWLKRRQISSSTSLWKEYIHKVSSRHTYLLLSWAPMPFFYLIGSISAATGLWTYVRVQLLFLQQLIKYVRVNLLHRHCYQFREWITCSRMCNILIFRDSCICP